MNCGNSLLAAYYNSILIIIISATRENACLKLAFFGQIGTVSLTHLSFWTNASHLPRKVENTVTCAQTAEGVVWKAI